MFDEAGFPDVKIVASNELDEFVINSIRGEGGCIDIYGVGTRLATCAGPGGGALGGVYKLVECAGAPRMKISSDPVKSTLPGRKRWLRAVSENGQFQMDILDLATGPGEPFSIGCEAYDPVNPERHKTIDPGSRLVECHDVVMEDGVMLNSTPALDEIADYCQEQLKCMPQGSLRLINPHRYKVGISERLLSLKTALRKDPAG